MRVSFTSIVTTVCIVGGLGIMAWNLYECWQEREAKVPQCVQQAPHRMVYSAEEHRRAARAIERMEKIK